jgi:hypothetical protein
MAELPAKTKKNVTAAGGDNLDLMVEVVMKDMTSTEKAGIEGLTQDEIRAVVLESTKEIWDGLRVEEPKKTLMNKMDPEKLKTIRRRIAKGGCCTMCAKPLGDAVVTMTCVLVETGETLVMPMHPHCHCN